MVSVSLQRLLVHRDRAPVPIAWAGWVLEQFWKQRLGGRSVVPAGDRTRSSGPLSGTILTELTWLDFAQYLTVNSDIVSHSDENTIFYRGTVTSEFSTVYTCVPVGIIKQKWHKRQC